MQTRSTDSPASQLIWIRLQGQRWSDLVSGQGCKTLDDVINVLKREYPNKLRNVSSDRISLHPPSNVEVYRRSALLSDICTAPGSIESSPLIVKIDYGKIPLGISKSLIKVPPRRQVHRGQSNTARRIVLFTYIITAILTTLIAIKKGFFQGLSDIGLVASLSNSFILLINAVDGHGRF